MRKTTAVTIQDEGRDKGKTFVLQEMPASQAEKWAARALLALSRSGIDLPENIAEGGMAGVAVLGLKALGGMNFADAEALLDEMFLCVTIKPDPNTAFTRALVEDDIEEVATRIRLRAEVFTLHTGFSFADAQSKLTSGTTSAA